MRIELCNEPYEPMVAPGESQLMRCQYLKDHPHDRHSWETAKQTVDAMLLAEADDTPQEIQVFLDAINDGRADDYLEAILAAGHAHKRTRRGVRLPYGVTR